MVLSSIAQLRQDFSLQFAALSQRLDSFVSAETHRADMRRIEARQEDLIADVGRERLERAEMRAELTEQIRSLTKAIEAEQSARQEAVAGEGQARVNGQRWAIGTLIAMAVAVIAVVGLFFHP
jgi:hypothetical protein